MRRRDLLAGAAGAGVLIGGGLAVAGGPLDQYLGDDESDTQRREYDPVTRAVVAGGDGETVSVPDTERATFLEFYATTCVTCNEMMPSLQTVHHRLADADIQMVSVTNERYLEDERLETDWVEKGGQWPLVRDTETATLATRYDGIVTPTSVLVDTEGRQQWWHRGRASTDQLLDGIESGHSSGLNRQ